GVDVAPSSEVASLRAGSAWSTSAGSRRIRNSLHVLLRPGTLGTPHMARLVGWHRAHRRWDAPPGLRSPVDSIRRARVAGDVLHDGHGTQPHERDRDRMGADAVACNTAGGV